MIPYILHVSILIAAGFLFYRLLLKKLTFYVLNRWILLSCLVLAFLLPLLPIPRQWSWREWYAAASVARPSAGETAVAPVTVSPAIVEHKPDVRSLATTPIIPYSKPAVTPVSGADVHEPEVGQVSKVDVPKSEVDHVLTVDASNPDVSPALPRVSASPAAPAMHGPGLLSRVLTGLFYLYLF